jgi:glycyl-radical enzyme activating protein
LRCLWCCNPEGQAYHPELKVVSSLCDGCGSCLEICPRGAIQLTQSPDGAAISVDRTLCDDCLACMGVCCTGALERFGVYYTVDELFAVVKKDEQYYNISDGGATIGGGEPTLQAGFVRAFLRKCREYYIHTALDTCGYTVSREGIRALEEADLLLFDIKGLDPNRHFVDTGVSNEVILRNLRRMDRIGKPIIVRMPIIPGHNDSEENVRATAELLAGLEGLQRVDLMAYHRYGAVKYSQLGKEYVLDAQASSEDLINQIKNTLESHGLKVQIGG